MADDTNIDDILKSIDALLKESEDQDERRSREAREHKPAINDDEHPDDEHHDEAADGSTDDGAPGPAAQERVEQEQVEQALAEHQQHLGELQQAGDAADMDDHPTNHLSEADVEEAGAVSEATPAVKRIVLSEDMLVEDNTPDLLDFVQQQGADADLEQQHLDELQQAGDAADMDDHPTNHLTEADVPQVQDEPGGDEERNDAPRTEEEASVAAENEPQSADVVHEAVQVDMDRLIDMDKLVKKISRDITAKLEDKLPGIVAKAVRKQLAAQMEKNKAD